MKNDINDVVKRYLETDRDPNFSVPFSARLPARTLGILFALAKQRKMAKTRLAQDLLIGVVDDLQKQTGIEPDYTFLKGHKSSEFKVIESDKEADIIVF